jgi:hypothetical protein
LRLPDLIARLRLLESQVRLGLRKLGGGLLHPARVKGLVRLPFLRLNDRQQLAVGYHIALLDQELLQAPLDFRAHNDFVRGDHPGEDDIPRTPGQQLEQAGGQRGGQNNQNQRFAFHTGSRMDE